MGDKVQKHNEETMPSGKSEPESKTKTSTPEEPEHIDSQTSAQVSDNPQFHSQYSSLPPYQHPDLSTAPGQNPYGSPASHGQQHPYNMSGMAGALPEYGQPMPQSYPRQQGHHPAAGASTPAIVYQMQQNLQYPPSTQYGAQAGYGGYGQLQYPAQYSQSPGSSPHGAYGSPYPQAQQRPPGAPPGQYSQSPVPYYYYQDPYGHQAGSPTTYSPQPSQFSGNVRGGAPGIVSGQMAESGGRKPSGGYGPPYQSGSPSGDESTMRASESATAAIPRGPPRKPKQSGHALWVGNLPPNTSIMTLKDHFSRDAKQEIESLFLISKSNCAFVNYRTEKACEKAVARFHDSRFQGVRLVCRLRKSSTAATGVPSAPSSMSIAKPPQLTGRKPPIEDDDDDDDDDEELEAVESSDDEKSPSPAKSSERYFVVKSLTLQDLEQSVRNGIWATQSHNEDVLNKAYNSADNVYLIFSANKSGEYFGYARMVSPISENAAEVYGTVPRTDLPDNTDTPKTIPTPATELAPKGHIIDDSARGTIFWEAEHSDDDTTDEESSDHGENIEAEPQTWGKPFRVEWMSTTRLPFYRTRGLRNPWNANREVKIARDGTELEPSVGQKLVQLFHRPGPSSTGQYQAPGPSSYG